MVTVEKNAIETILLVQFCPPSIPMSLFAAYFFKLYNTFSFLKFSANLASIIIYNNLKYPKKV